MSDGATCNAAPCTEPTCTADSHMHHSSERHRMLGTRKSNLAPLQRQHTSNTTPFKSCRSHFFFPPCWSPAKLSFMSETAMMQGILRLCRQFQKKKTLECVLEHLNPVLDQIFIHNSAYIRKYNQRYTGRDASRYICALHLFPFTFQNAPLSTHLNFLACEKSVQKNFKHTKNLMKCSK